MITKLMRNNLLLKGLLFFFIISLMGLSTSLNYQKLLTSLFMPFLLLLVICKNGFKLSFLKNKSLKNHFLILVLSSILLFQAIQIEIGISNLIQLVGVLIGGVIVVESIKYNRELLPWILFFFVIGFYVSVFYMFKNITSNTDIASQYLDRSVYDLNANKYSYYSLLANFALFFLIELKKRRILIILSIFTTLLAIYVSFYTASRSGMLFTAVPAVIYWMFIFEISTSSYLKFLKNTFVFIAIIFISQKVYDIYSNSYLKKRVEYGAYQQDGRVSLANDALNVFIDHPFIGVGPAQFAFYGDYQRGSYSHNSFLEAATNLGIIGLALVIILFFKPLLHSLKIKNKGLKKVSMMFFLIFILYNIFYVFYWSLIEMMFFFIVTEIYYLDKSNFK